MTLVDRIVYACRYFLIALLHYFLAPPRLCLRRFPPPSNFLAENYDVSATLDSSANPSAPSPKSILAPPEVSSSVRVELHPNLVVSEVKGRRRQTPHL